MRFCAATLDGSPSVWQDADSRRPLPFPRVEGWCDMSEQPTNVVSSVSDQGASVMPWIGGAVGLAIVVGIVGSFWYRQISPATPPPSSAATARDSVPTNGRGLSLAAAGTNASTVAEQKGTAEQRAIVPVSADSSRTDSKPIPPAADSAKGESAVATPSPTSSPAPEASPAAPQRRSASYPPPDDTAKAPTVPATSTAPATDSANPSAPNASASASAASSSGEGFIRGRNRRRWRLRRVSLLRFTGRDQAEKMIA